MCCQWVMLRRTARPQECSTPTTRSMFQLQNGWEFGHVWDLITYLALHDEGNGGILWILCTQSSRNVQAYWRSRTNKQDQLTNIALQHATPADSGRVKANNSIHSRELCRVLKKQEKQCCDPVPNVAAVLYNWRWNINNNTNDFSVVFLASGQGMIQI